eukprot:m.1077033 g.1077033  ORF g.1077033 m.1077033 type:complete len:138 (+) comp24251_c0_seq3:210-623(+)
MDVTLVLLVCCAAVVLTSATLPCESGNTLYNGICLPVQWPPRIELSRSYTQPGYIDNPPAVINIDTGRQLFVDNFLIDSNASKNIETAYHTPQYRQDNPGGEIVDIYCLTEEGCCVLDVHFVAVALLVYCFCGASSS